MKRTEIAMIILIASLSMLLTFTLVRSLLGDKIERTATVKEAVEISDQIEQPAKRVFNEKAINPTVEVCVQTDEAASTDEEVVADRGGDCDSSRVSTETDIATPDDQESVEAQPDDTDPDTAETNDN